MRGHTGFAGEIATKTYATDVIANVAAPLRLADLYLRAAIAGNFVDEIGLVMMSSAAARSPYPGQSVYCTGKAALEMWVHVTRRELALRGRDNIWITAVRPGFVDTGLTGLVANLADTDYPVASNLRSQLASGDQAMDIDTAARQIWAALPPAASLLLFGEQVKAPPNQPAGS